MNEYIYYLEERLRKYNIKIMKVKNSFFYNIFTGLKKRKVIKILKRRVKLEKILKNLKKNLEK